MITFRIDFSSIFDRQMVEKLLKNQSKNDEKNKSKKHAGKSKNLKKLKVLSGFFDVPLVPNSQKNDQKIFEKWV